MTGQHAVVNISGSIYQHTWPQKLTSHGVLYWIVHILIAVGGAGFVEFVTRYWLGSGAGP